MTGMPQKLKHEWKVPPPETSQSTCWHHTCGCGERTETGSQGGGGGGGVTELGTHLTIQLLGELGQEGYKLKASLDKSPRLMIPLSLPLKVKGLDLALERLPGTDEPLAASHTET